MTRFRRDEAFTLVELLTVIVIITMILMITFVIYHGVTARTDLKAAVEMLKQDIRKVYALADSGVAVTDGSTKHRDQYRIEFHTDSGAPLPNPRSAYRIIKRTWNTGSHTWNAWTVVAPQKQTAVQIVSSDWIRPTMSSNTVIYALNGMTQDATTGNYGITFISKGSIITTDCLGDATVTLRSNDQGKNMSITVSSYGSVAE
ncbi:MAG: prepilin-type N-terminal cleavage/methylation domain-containing protein [Actinobacteria bacterium]|nr:prepilin-type N-terminal cleavage/methylation domain-containing protein [Actinomycetota bacterium]MBU1942244.1 prepilin-type N-terminal cleavage/methylation domain-containing protein [Actinomycetota bacterium]MBU2687407.1 prepilin-type N-terminal cleavage/methylation domain-containing protein [Actinomycetota bacterium]